MIQSFVLSCPLDDAGVASWSWGKRSLPKFTQSLREQLLVQDQFLYLQVCSCGILLMQFLLPLENFHLSHQFSYVFLGRIDLQFKAVPHHGIGLAPRHGLLSHFPGNLLCGWHKTAFDIPHHLADGICGAALVATGCDKFDEQEDQVDEDWGKGQ